MTIRGKSSEMTALQYHDNIISAETVTFLKKIKSVTVGNSAFL